MYCYCIFIKGPVLSVHLGLTPDVSAEVEGDFNNSATLQLKMDSKANSYDHKWPSPPQCLAAVLGRNTLQLPLKALNLGNKREKVRLVFETTLS